MSYIIQVNSYTNYSYEINDNSFFHMLIGRYYCNSHFYNLKLNGSGAVYYSKM